MDSPLEKFRQVILEHALRLGADRVLVDSPLADEAPAIRFHSEEEWSELTPPPPAELIAAFFQSLVDVLGDPNMTDRLDDDWELRRSAESQVVLARATGADALGSDELGSDAPDSDPHG